MDPHTFAKWKEVYRFYIDDRCYRIWRTHKNELYVMFERVG